MTQRWRTFIAASLLVVLPVLTACGQIPAQWGLLQTTSTGRARLPDDLAPVTLDAKPLATRAGPCTDTFAVHKLGHISTIDGVPRMYGSNGSGVAINDLDNNGDLDIVLANLDGSNTILWNEGNLHFRTQSLLHGDSRAANIIDVDGNGWQDIIFTRRTLAPTYWRNTGGETGVGPFVEAVLPGVNYSAYAMNWFDLDRDGDLDLVTGSYDAGLEKDLGTTFFYVGGGVGVYYYQNEGDLFAPQHLASKAHALAVAFVDFNGNGQPGILIGNDFDMPDYAWQQDESGWREVQPLAATTHSTMGFDLGDIDNDGRSELFATDMKPYNTDIRTLAEWRPMMSKMPHNTFRGDPQVMENVLQVWDSQGRFRNQAYARAVDATGWSWSGKFGDLDNDGFLDLYVVNGMIASDLFGYLPNNELVEENQAFRNDGSGYFVRVPEWGLGSTASGRGMSMADLDNDGDLDIVVNNLQSPALLFENRQCSGASLQVDLFQPETMNTRAIGARLVLHTSTGSYQRDVRAASGYLSGDPARVHFGFPNEAIVERLDIYWPDGSVSSVSEVTSNTMLAITRER